MEPAPDTDFGHAIDSLRERILMLEEQSNVYNTTIIAMAMLAGIKKGSFKYMEAADFKNFLLNELRPFVANAMRVAEQSNQLMKEEEDARKEANDKAKSTKELKANAS